MWMRRLLVPALCGAIAVSTTVGTATGSSATARESIAPVAATDTGGVAQATCFWFGPMSIDDKVTNKAYPDAGALYWGARFRLPPGSVLRLAGRFPHARFMSVNSYGRVDGVEHAAVDSLEDKQIVPDKGSTNPYFTGADRYSPNRSYRVTIPADDLGKRGRNFLDVPSTNAGAVQELIYRVYLPDRDRDANVRSLPKPRLTLADGTRLRGSQMCDAINDAQRFFTFQAMPAALYKLLVNTPGADPATNSAFPFVRWEKFFNTPLALSVYRVGTPSADMRLNDLAIGVAGGYYDNLSVRYSVGPINAAYGDVLVLRGKLPTTPRTGPGVRTMGSGQMRYWSICQNTSPVDTAAVDCVADHQVRKVIDKKRHYTIVVSRRSDRPVNATMRCDVAWLDWGNHLDSLGRRSGTLVMRNLESAPSFRRSLQKVGLDDVDVVNVRNRSEKQVLGPYQPRGEYMSTKQFERRGCSADRTPGLG